MKLRKFDGFDAVSGATCMLKYPGTFINFLQASAIAGRPGPVSSGPNGNSIFLFNTAFGEANFTDILDAQSTWGIHMDFRMWNNGLGASYPDVEWYRIGNASQTMLALRQRTDGKMDVRSYDSHGVLTTLLTTAFVFPPNDFITLELLATFGTSGTWELRVAGNNVIGSGAHNFGTALPDRLTYRFQGFGPPGPNLDNYVIQDGSAGPIEHLGPARITTLSPVADLTGTWSRNGPGSLFGAISDLGGPDGDVTYLTPGALSARTGFQVRKSPCFGLNLGLAVNICGRPNGGSPHVGPTVRERAATNLILPELLLTDQGTSLSTDPNLRGYGTYQVITTQSFETGGPWTDSRISNSAWGFDADNSVPGERVTQFYLEKLTTLLLKPFDCGGPSAYSY